MLASIKQSPNYKWWVFSTVATGTFMSVMGHGSVLIALPAIASHFNASLTTVVWIAIGEALTISALLLPMGRLSDIVGRKQVYVVGYAVFLVASAAAGFSVTLSILLMARVAQGVGEAMLQSNGQAMVLSVFPGSERGKALGTQFSVVGTGSIVGMVAGGFLVSALGWEWVFLINIPVGLFALMAAILVLDKSRFVLDRQGGQRPRFDWQGSTLSATALVIVLLALTFGNRAGWSSGPILGAMVAFAVRVDHPSQRHRNDRHGDGEWQAIRPLRLAKIQCGRTGPGLASTIHTCGLAGRQHILGAHNPHIVASKRWLRPVRFTQQQLHSQRGRAVPIRDRFGTHLFDAEFS